MSLDIPFYRTSPVSALIRWDEFCMSPLAPQRSMKTGSSLTKLC